MQSVTAVLTSALAEADRRTHEVELCFGVQRDLKAKCDRFRTGLLLIAEYADLTPQEIDAGVGLSAAHVRHLVEEALNA